MIQVSTTGSLDEDAPRHLAPGPHFLVSVFGILACIAIGGSNYFLLLTRTWPLSAAKALGRRAFTFFTLFTLADIAGPGMGSTFESGIERFHSAKALTNNSLGDGRVSPRS